MGMFNSVYVYKPVNKQASSVFSAGVKSRVSAKRLKKQKDVERPTHLDDVFEAKCADVAAKRKADSKMRKRAMAKANNCKRGKRGIFGKQHW